MSKVFTFQDYENKIKKQTIERLRNLQLRVDFLHITENLNNLKKELEKEALNIYRDIYNLDLFITGDCYNRDPKVDIPIIFSLYYYKDCSFNLSIPESLKPSSIKINIWSRTIEVLGDPYCIDIFNELRYINEP